MCKLRFDAWHNFNLTIQDTTKSVVESAIFSDLDMCATTIKASHKRMDIWKEEVPNNRCMGNIGETRWWSKYDVLGKVFGKYGHPSSSLYVALAVTLGCLLPLLVRQTKQNIIFLRDRLFRFKSVLSAQLFSRIFEKITPLSKYLQTKQMDVLKSHQMVQSTIASLEEISRDFTDLINKSRSFVQLENVELEKKSGYVMEQRLPTPRGRRNDQDPEHSFEVNVHNVVLDNVVTSLNTRFADHGTLFSDLACLDPNLFLNVSEAPITAFEKLSSKVIRFNKEATPLKIKSQLINFSSKWDRLKVNLEDSYNNISRYLLVDVDEYSEQNE